MKNLYFCHKCNKIIGSNEIKYTCVDCNSNLEIINHENELDNFLKSIPKNGEKLNVKYR